MIVRPVFFFLTLINENANKLFVNLQKPTLQCNLWIPFLFFGGHGTTALVATP